jgi:kynureninase
MIHGEYRDQFHIPILHGRESVYLCGNSLGLQPRNAKEYVNQELDDWAELGVEGHFHARHPWLPYHEFLTKSAADLVGGNKNEVVVMNSLTVNLHLLMASFYRPSGKRFKILIESDAFPSDRYAVASQAKWHGYNPAEAILQWRPEAGEYCLRIETLKEILEKEGETISLILLGGVNYYTGQYFNINEITKLAHQYDIIIGWDLAHAAGNVDMDLHAWNVDFAAWCSYKYLNSGPGSLGAVFIHDRHGNNPDIPRLAGWWGHNKVTRFKMRDDFDPLPGAEGWQLSNPPILPLAAMRASFEIFDTAGIKHLREASKKLIQPLYESLKNIKGIQVITPSDPEERGCQVSLLVNDRGRELFDHLSRFGVVADWREPDVIRIAPVPLYNTPGDINHFLETIDMFYS